MRVKVVYSAPPRPQVGEVLRLFVRDPSGPVVRVVRAGEVVELEEVGRYERALLAQGKLAEVVERTDPADLFVDAPPAKSESTLDVEVFGRDQHGKAISETISLPDDGSTAVSEQAFQSVGAREFAAEDEARPGKLYVDDVVAAAGLPTASHPSEVTAPPAQKRRPGRPRKSRPE